MCGAVAWLVGGSLPIDALVSYTYIRILVALPRAYTPVDVNERLRGARAREPQMQPSLNLSGRRGYTTMTPVCVCATVAAKELIG